MHKTEYTAIVISGRPGDRRSLGCVCNTTESLLERQAPRYSLKMSTHSFFPNFKPARKKIFQAFLFSTLLLFALRFLAIANITELYLGGSLRDAGLYVWLSKVALSALSSGEWYNTNAFYPYTLSLAWSDNYIFPSLLFHALTTLGAPGALAYNIPLLAAQLLSGTLTYILAFRLSGKHLSSLLSGLTFMSLSYTSSQLGHPQMQWLCFLPLSFILFVQYVTTEKKLFAFLLGSAITLCFLTSVYIAFYAAYALLFLSLVLFLQKPSKPFLKSLFVLLLSALPGLLLSLLFVWPYVHVKNTFGIRHLYEAQAFSLDILDYFSASSYNLVYGKLFSARNQESAVFCGFSLLALLPFAYRRLIAGKNMRRTSFLFILSTAALIISNVFAVNEYIQLVFLWIVLLSFLYLIFLLGKNERFLNCFYITNRNLIASLLALALIFFIFSLGPLASYDDSLFPPSPHSVAYYTLPGFSALRASSRFAFCVYFFICLLLPFLLPKNVRNKKSFACSLLLLVLLENYVTAYPLEPAEALPEIVETLKNKVEKNDAVLMLPMTVKGAKKGGVKKWGDYALHSVRYMNWNSDNSFSLINGYSGQRSYLINQLPFKLRNFPDETSLGALSEIVNLRYVLVFKEFVTDRDTFFNALAAHSSQVRLIAEHKENFLLELNLETHIDDSFLLRVPSYPKHGTATLQIKNLAGAQRLNIFLKPYRNETPALSLPLSQLAGWQELRFNVPETIDRVRPRLLRFELEESKKNPKQTNKILLGARRYEKLGAQ